LPNEAKTIGDVYVDLSFTQEQGEVAVRKLGNQDGFTSVELLFVVVIILSIVGFIWGVVANAILAGNFWYTEEGVLRDIQIDHPGIMEVIRSERNVYDDSVITVKNDAGSRFTFTLDSDIFFNYVITESKK